MSDIKYERIISAVMASPWAILPAKLAIIQSLLAFRLSGERLTAEEIKERLAGERVHVGAAAPVQKSSGQRGVAVLPLVGTIIPRADMFSESSGAVSVQRFTRNFRQALADPEVGSIVIDIDSPGGQVDGVEELATEIYQSRGIKPVTAVANTMAASAAYWIGSAAAEFVVTPSGEVGSIGVFAMHEDWSKFYEQRGIELTFISAGKYKVEGNPFAPLSEEAAAYMQSRVDDYYNMFTAAVARGRGIGVDMVRNGFGQGRMVGANDAAAMRMVDRVATLDEVITGELAKMPAGTNSASAELDYRKRRLRTASL